jgi:hypothetical protein
MAVLKTCSQCTRDFEGRANKRFCSSECVFWSRVDRSGGPDACWKWTGYINPATGYGSVSGGLFGKQRAGSHRIAYRLHYGADPGEMHVLHRCDNPLCCNGRHLSLGTNLDNWLDALAKGRPVITAPGVLNYNARLSDSLVRMIRESPDPAKQLASNLGVSASTIAAVRKGITWRHVA